MDKKTAMLVQSVVLVVLLALGTDAVSLKPPILYHSIDLVVTNIFIVSITLQHNFLPVYSALFSVVPVALVVVAAAAPRRRLELLKQGFWSVPADFFNGNGSIQKGDEIFDEKDDGNIFGLSIWNQTNQPKDHESQMRQIVCFPGDKKG